VTIVDAYAHVGLPRFLSAGDYRSVMEEAGVGAGVLVSFGACADLRRIHRACQAEPTRFRGVGVPLGRGRTETEGFLTAQLRAGFAGIRLESRDIRERPWILDLVWRYGGFIFAMGDLSDQATAAALLRSLDDGPDRLVVAPHLAGCGRGRAEEPRGAWGELLDHERFAVIMSRQGAYPAGVATAWTDLLIGRVGWQRLMWGSEAPVLFWRDESVPEALRWYDRFLLRPEDRSAFLGATAARLLLARPLELGPLDLPFESASRQDRSAVPLFPAGQRLDPSVAGRLIHHWIATRGSARTSLGEHVERLLAQALEQVDLDRLD
jgi:predicted TIM-barrel fold metal-dependent hydrolase